MIAKLLGEFRTQGKINYVCKLLELLDLIVAKSTMRAKSINGRMKMACKNFICQKKRRYKHINQSRAKRVWCVETKMNLIRSDARKVAYSFELIININKNDHSMVDPCARLIPLAKHSNWRQLASAHHTQLNNVNRYTLKNVQSHDNTHANQLKNKSQSNDENNEKIKTTIDHTANTHAARHGTFTIRLFYRKQKRQTKVPHSDTHRK